MNNIPQILQAIEEATEIVPTAFSTSEIQHLPAISYQAYRQGDNAVIESWRFSTRVTAESLEEAITIEEQIANTLVSLGDEEDWHGALSIQINGGGTIEDPATGFPQLMTYYDINVRS